MRHRTRRGAVLLEMVCSTGIAILLGVMLVTFVRITLVSQQLTKDMHNAETLAWRPLHRLSDNLRKAQTYGTNNATLATGTATSLTLYDDSSGNTSRYWLDAIAVPQTLNRTRGTATQVLATGLTNLRFTYYLATGNAQSAGACWTTTANPNAPTTTEMPNVVAVGITITIPVDGTSRDITTKIRLRNAPRTISGH